MSTGTGAETGANTAAVSRQVVLIQQINAIVRDTTGSATFREVLEKGVKNRWIGKVFVRGLTSQGLIVQQIEVEIDWQEHLLRVNDPSQATIEIKLDGPERNRLSNVVGGIIEGFNEITQLKGLKADWVVRYTPEGNARSAEVDRVLGLVSEEPRQWVSGRREPVYSPYRLKRMPELQLSWEVATEF